MLIMKANEMGPKDLLLITCNEFCGIRAIVLLNEKRMTVDGQEHRID